MKKLPKITGPKMLAQKSEAKAGAAAKPELTRKVFDPKKFSSRSHQPKKTESDVQPAGKRPGGSKERLRDKFI